MTTGAGAGGIRRRLLAMAAAVAILGACQIGSEPEETPSTTSPAPSATVGSPYGGSALVWVNPGLKPISAVRVVAGVPLLFTYEGRLLQLTALDPATGARRWSRPASTSQVPPGLAWGVRVVGKDRVAYLAPASDGGGTAFMVILDPTGDGTEVARSGQHQFFAPPTECPTEPGVVCSTRGVTGGFQAVRFAEGMKEIAPVEPVTFRYLQPIGPRGLTRLDRGDGTRIGVVDGPTVRWSKPVAEVLGANYDLDRGWSFDEVPNTDLVVGSISVQRAGSSAPLAELFETVAIDVKTGEVRWRSVGPTTWCDAPFTADDATDPLLACQFTAGSVVGLGTPDARYVNPTMSLVRLDPQTGAVSWTRDIGKPTLGDDEWLPRLTVVGNTAVVVGTATGQVRVSLTDGASRPATAADVGWRVVESSSVAGTVSTAYATSERHGWIYEPYVDGQVATTVRLPLPEMLGTTPIAGVRIVATPRGVLAYPAK